MDEPTIGLDPHQIIIVRNLIASLRGRMSVIISSHILPEIEETCDRVLIINGGRIVAQGSPADLRHEIFGHSTYRIELGGDTAGAGRPSSPASTWAWRSFRRATPARRFPGGHRDDEISRGSRRKTPAGAARRRLPRALPPPRTQPSLEGCLPRRHRRSWDARLPDKQETQGDSRAPAAESMISPSHQRSAFSSQPNPGNPGLELIADS